MTHDDLELKYEEWMAGLILEFCDESPDHHDPDVALAFVAFLLERRGLTCSPGPVAPMMKRIRQELREQWALTYGDDDGPRKAL